jgi:Zn-dependent M16 (insulinase) family peptidase
LTQKLAKNKKDDMISITKPSSLLSKEGEKPGQVGVTIVPMTTLDSSYSVSTAKGITGLRDKDFPVLMAAIGYLESPEGPLWNAVRGGGYAYGAYFSRDLDSGALSYRVYRSPDASKAVNASREVIRKVAEGEVEIDRHLLEGTISQIILMFADEQATMPSAAQQNFVVQVIRNLPKDWPKEMMSIVRNVDPEDMKRVMRDIIMPVFAPGSSNIVVTCGKLMSEGMDKSFQEMGYKTSVKELSDFHDDFGLKAGENEEEDDEDDEEDDEEYSGSDDSEEDSDED